MKTFRDVIMDRILNMIVWGAPVPGEINKGLLKQVSDGTLDFNQTPRADTTMTADPNPGYSSFIWRYYERPIHPESVGSNDLIPSLFISFDGITRRFESGPTLNNINARSFGSKLELVRFGIQVLTNNSHGTGKPLSRESLGIISDIDILLNPYTLTDIDFYDILMIDGETEYNENLKLYALHDAGIGDCVPLTLSSQTGSTTGGRSSPNEILDFSLEFVMEFPIKPINRPEE